MIPNYKLHLISAHPLWLQAFSRALLDSQLAQQVSIVPIEANYALSNNIVETLSSGDTPDLVLVATESQTESTDILRTIRTVGYRGSIVAIVSRHAVPALEELKKFDVQGIISFSHGMEELENTIRDTLNGCVEPLELQYSRLCKMLNLPCPRTNLNEREREILELVGHDLTDQEIAERLNVSVRTINNHLRHIYAKLHVRTRLGAVLAALAEGLITPLHD